VENREVFKTNTSCELIVNDAVDYGGEDAHANDLDGFHYQTIIGLNQWFKPIT
jgi:hypothetical protein